MIASTAPKPSQAATSWTITSVEATRAMYNIFGWWLHKCDHCWLQVTSSCTNTLWRTDPRCTAVLSVARLAETGATWGSTWKTFTFPEVSLIVANTARRPSPLEPILTTMWPTYTKMPKSVIDEYTNGLLNWRFSFLWIRPKVPCLQAGTSSCMSILWRIPREARTATNAQFVGKLAMIEATWENTWKMLILTGSFHMSANIALQSLGHAPNLITMSQQHTKASIHLLEIHFSQRAKGFFMLAPYRRGQAALRLYREGARVWSTRTQMYSLWKNWQWSRKPEETRWECPFSRDFFIPVQTLPHTCSHIPNKDKAQQSYVSNAQNLAILVLVLTCKC